MEKSSVYYGQVLPLQWLVAGLCSLLVLALVVPVTMLQGAWPCLLAAAGGIVVTLCGAVVHELWPRGLLRRKRVCAIGADGILFEGVFHPWGEVQWVERGSSAPGGTYNHVTLKLRGRPETVQFKLRHAERLVKDVAQRMAALPDTATAPTEPGYRRGRVQSRSTLIRISIDGSAPLQERLNALSKLDADTRQEVVRATVEPRLADAVR